MTINVNNQLHSISENTSLTQLLEEFNMASNGIAIAINNKVISKDAWSRTLLDKEDQVIIIQATQGG